MMITKLIYGEKMMLRAPTKLTKANTRIARRVSKPPGLGTAVGSGTVTNIAPRMASTALSKSSSIPKFGITKLFTIETKCTPIDHTNIARPLRTVWIQGIGAYLSSSPSTENPAGVPHSGQRCCLVNPRKL